MQDTAVFKKLAHNDTGLAAGHQGGIVIPKEIAQFFPQLPPVTLASGPTVDAILIADLIVDGKRVGTISTRYQHQTWGGKRSPERRLTDNLGPLRNLAREGDIVLFSKDLDVDSCIEIRLIRQGSDEFQRVFELVGARRWGVLDRQNPPVSIQELEDAEAYITSQASTQPVAFVNGRREKETVSVRKARDRAFRRRVLEQYDFQCAFTGRTFASPLGMKVVGLDAAHVVPVAELGSDHPANGLPLTKDLHWAFDKGLIGVKDDRTVFVPHSVRSIPGNEFLRDLHGTPIREAREQTFRVMSEALEWHRENRLINGDHFSLGV